MMAVQVMRDLRLPTHMIAGGGRRTHEDGAYDQIGRHGGLPAIVFLPVEYITTGPSDAHA